MHGMKSHDCHVPCNGCFQLHSMHYQNIFGSRLLKLATFQRTNFNNINVEHLRVMENNIHALLCKLEQIFPSSFFDSMKHLPIHLPYEARVGGLVQNCWMYPFERYETSKSFFKLVINHCIIYSYFFTWAVIFLFRFLHSLKSKVKNKARVKGSICEAYLVDETSTFVSFYYPDRIQTRRTSMTHNVDVGEGSSATPPISIFNYLGRVSEKSITYYLDSCDFDAAHLYVLQNCEEVESYLG